MGIDDVRVVDEAMRGNELLFNFEIAAWNRIKKELIGNGKKSAEKTRPKVAFILLEKGLPINVFSSLEKVEAVAKSNTNYHWASFDVQ